MTVVMRCSNTVSHLSCVLVDSLSEIFVLLYSLLMPFFFKLGTCDTAVLKHTVSPRILKLHFTKKAPCYFLKIQERNKLMVPHCAVSTFPSLFFFF